MPTILTVGAFEFMVYPNDHEPSHIHVFVSGAEVVINLGDERTPPQIRKVKRMTRRAAKKALRLAAENQEVLLAGWRRIHGQG